MVRGGQRPWFDANLPPVPERCTARARRRSGASSSPRAAARSPCCGRGSGNSSASRALAEPLAPVGYPAYVAEVLATHTPQSVMALVEAAPGDFNRRFKNLHHKISHGHPIEYL